MFTINNVCNPYGIHYIPELKESKVNYVIYSVNKVGLLPFVSFYLENNYNILSFPYTLDNHPIINMSDGIDHIYKIMTAYRENIEYIKSTGYVVDYLDGSLGNTNIYIFYEVTISPTEAIGMSKNQLIWPVVFWEIFNTGIVFDKLIEVTVIRALYNHITLLPLKEVSENHDINSKDLPYPIVGYSVHKRNQLQFRAMFGESRNPDGPMGDYFYYYKTLSGIISDVNSKESYGVVRYVITNTHSKSIFDEFKNSVDDNIIGISDKYILTSNIALAYPFTYHLI